MKYFKRVIAFVLVLTFTHSLTAQSEKFKFGAMIYPNFSGNALNDNMTKNPPFLEMRSFQ